MIDPTFASDGIDEILTAMAPRAHELPLESHVTMAIHAVPTANYRAIGAGGEGRVVSRGQRNGCANRDSGPFR